MMIKLLYRIALSLLVSGSMHATDQNYAAALHVQDVQAYHQDILKHPDHRLVEIVKAIPGIALDVTYATTNNFTHRRMYPQARAFARLPVVKALKQIQAELKAMGLGLKIFDGYRPYAITVDFFKIIRDTIFVADPKLGSKHNRGCAVDLTLIDLQTGREISMPTDFDSFNASAGADYVNLPPEIIKHRELLKSVMQAHGFTVNRGEWWHYDFNGWRNFPIVDVPFSDL